VDVCSSQKRDRIMKTQNVWPEFGQKVRAKLPSFTALRRAVLVLWMLMHRRPKILQPSNLYQGCNECPLDVFIDCLVNNKLERLIKSGEASQKELAEAWQKIWFEYCDLSDNPEYRNMLNLIKETSYLESKLLTIRLCLQKIIHKPDENCIAILKKYGYRYDFDKSDEAKFIKDIEQVLAISKSIEIEVLRNRKQLEKSQEVKHDKVNQSTFDKMLVVMSKWIGYRLDKKILTVSEYALIGKMMEVESNISESSTKSSFNGRSKKINGHINHERY